MLASIIHAIQIQLTRVTDLTILGVILIFYSPGANCSVPVWLDDPAPALAPDSVLAGEGGGAGTAVGVVITILVLSLAITVTVYYRKRFHSLKTQLSHVHYSATGGGHQAYHQGPDPDQHHGSLLCAGGGPHHFDNPVYATCRRDTGTGSLNNTTRLHNTIVKNVNRSREKERSLTLPAPRRLAGAGARLAEETAEEEMSDTISEKGVYYLIFVPFNTQSYKVMQSQE